MPKRTPNQNMYKNIFGEIAVIKRETKKSLNKKKAAVFLNWKAHKDANSFPINL